MKTRWLGVMVLVLGSAVARGADQGVPADWLGKVQRDIRQSEYRFSQAPDGSWSAPNRAQDLRSHISEGVLRVTSRTKSEATWSLDLRLNGFGRGDALLETPPGRTQADNGRAEIARPDVVEWYVNDERGLEQGFTLVRPPSVGDLDRSVTLEVAISGSLSAHMVEDGGAIEFRTAQGTAALRYANLTATDAAGQALVASLAVLPNRLQIRIDDRGAVYPVTVDPLMTSPAWTLVGSYANDNLGWSVATAGDVNGDGFSDVVIGVPLYDNGPNLYINGGRVFVYSGSANGLDATHFRSFDVPSTCLAGTDIQFGYSVATAGDVDHDGDSEFIVGAVGCETSAAAADEGVAFVFNGAPDVAGVPLSGLSSTPAWNCKGNETGALLGYSVATAGDINGDGFSDVILGEPFSDAGGNNSGRVLVFFGSQSGLGQNGTPQNAPWTAKDSQSGALFGSTVSSAGDTNGDGFGEIIVGSPSHSQGRAYLWIGSATGLGQNGTINNAAWTASGAQGGMAFGVVSTAGDVNGDGYSDVVIGAPLYDTVQTDAGRVFVWYGGQPVGNKKSGLGDDGTTGTNTNVDWSAVIDVAGAQFGHSVATAGDVNGDGFADLIVGAHVYTAGGSNNIGAAYVYLGSGAGLANAPAWSQVGQKANAQYGYSAATAGDVNGDGFSDVIVGSPKYDLSPGDYAHGKVYVYYGGVDGPSTTPGWTRTGDFAGDHLGTSVAMAGDVNGDGYTDILVSADGYDHGSPDEGRVLLYRGSPTGPESTAAWSVESDQPNAEFGMTVGPAGDVNGDGFGDVIIGSYLYDDPESEEGAALVYMGGPSGLGLTAAWRAEGNLTGTQLGWVAATAGDVNGDGFSDVIVGSSTWTFEFPYEGRVFVWYGGCSNPNDPSKGASGLGPDGTYLNADWNARGHQAMAFFGSSAASAGDVNGDGFSDVIVGAPGINSTGSGIGLASVFLGSSGGLSANAAWLMFDSGYLNIGLGRPVTTAGDLNGDGYSDIAVGAPGAAGHGQVFVWFGGASGLGPNGTVANADWTVAGGSNNASFGAAIAPAGDVNGDGFSDLIIGDPGYSNPESSEGAAYVYLGLSTGLNLGYGWMVEGGQSGAQLGNAVGGAGDVNGDGFADVIVGASRYDVSANDDRGRALVYFGNNGDGLDRIARQARASGPIDVLGFSDAGSVVLKALGRTPMGRGKVGLQWEIKPMLQPFNGSSLGAGTLVDTGAPAAPAGSAVALSSQISLTTGLRYHWRARIVTNSPFFPHSPWLSIPDNGKSEMDFWTPSAPILCP